VEFGDVFKCLHGGQRPLCVLLELLIVRTVLVHLSFPLEDGTGHILGVDAQQVRPYLFAMQEIFEAALSAIIEEFGQVLCGLTGLGLSGVLVTLLKIASSDYWLINLYNTCLRCLRMGDCSKVIIDHIGRLIILPLLLPYSNVMVK
jgi:hypothetical protein